MLPLCQSEGIGVIPWSPLARGRLTRAWEEKSSTSRSTSDDVMTKLYSQTEEADRKVVDRVGEIAAARGVPRAQIALAWVLANPVVTSPIVGATKPHHLEDAIAALSLELRPTRSGPSKPPTCRTPWRGLCEETKSREHHRRPRYARRV